MKFFTRLYHPKTRLYQADSKDLCVQIARDRSTKIYSVWVTKPVGKPYLARSFFTLKIAQSFAKQEFFNS